MSSNRSESSRVGARPSAAEREAAGKAARSRVPRSRHGEWEPPADRRDPVAVLEDQAKIRVRELVPIRYGRMLASPVSFYRGAAAIMAMDLAGTPDTGLRVQLCGDAHLSNFGIFAAPDRRLVWDLNDFDETLPGPWEWDVKRLAASFAIAGRVRGFATRDIGNAVLTTVSSYREAMREFAGMGNLEVWYARLDVERILAELVVPSVSTVVFGRAKIEHGKDAGRPRTGLYAADRGRSQAKVCSRSKRGRICGRDH